MSWTVWTDGSGTTGGPAGIGYYAVCNEYGHSGTHTGSLPVPNATNQQAEILAAAFALHELPAGSEVAIVSDSEYLVLGWNEYPRRKRKKNLAHWARLERAAERHAAVTFEWTRGHVGTEGNETADRLAGEARREAMRQRDVYALATEELQAAS